MIEHTTGFFRTRSRCAIVVLFHNVEVILSIFGVQFLVIHFSWSRVIQSILLLSHIICTCKSEELARISVQDLAESVHHTDDFAFSSQEHQDSTLWQLAMDFADLIECSRFCKWKRNVRKEFSRWNRPRIYRLTIVIELGDLAMVNSYRKRPSWNLYNSRRAGGEQLVVSCKIFHTKGGTHQD